jgi:hypothetical protein
MLKGLQRGKRNKNQKIEVNPLLRIYMNKKKSQKK